jgi:hypothetical protein
VVVCLAMPFHRPKKQQSPLCIIREMLGKGSGKVEREFNNF